MLIDWLFVGFKRRGMLVNHLAKRHPDVPYNTVPELNMPIVKVTFLIANKLFVIYVLIILEYILDIQRLLLSVL